MFDQLQGNMSCVFRISGDSLDIDALLSNHSLTLHRAWKKGEPRILKGRFYSDSGANFIASAADLDQFEIQLAEATDFLTQHASDIASIAVFPGVQRAILDFAVALNEGYVMHSSYLLPHFIALAAAVGIGVEISHYACSNDNEVHQPLEM